MSFRTLLKQSTFLLAFGFSASQAESPGPDRLITTLFPGQAHSNIQNADEIITYQFHALAGENFLIDIEQHNLDLIVSITHPNGTTLLANSPLLRKEHELIYLENLARGNHLISLHSEEFTGATGGHTITIETPGPGEPQLAALRLMTIGASTHHALAEGADATDESPDEDKTGQWRDLADLYLQAAKLSKNAGHTRIQAQAVYSAAMIQYWRVWNWNRAIELAILAAELYLTAEEPALNFDARRLQAAALLEAANELPDTSTGADEPDREAMLAHALSIFQDAKQFYVDRASAYDVAELTNNIGLTEIHRGHRSQARDLWVQAAELFRQLDEWSGEILALQNQAVIDAELGQLADSIAVFERILSILPAEKSPGLRATMLENLGSAYRIFGNFDQSLEALLAALTVFEAQGDVNGQAQSLSNLGETYFSIGDMTRARDYFERSRAKALQSGNGSIVVISTRELGNIQFQLRDFGDALSLHQQALDLTDQPTVEGKIRTLIARDHIELGQYSEANRQARIAHERGISTGYRRLQADALLVLGRTEQALNQPQAALSAYAAALAMFEELRLTADQAETLHQAAKVWRSTGNLKNAIALSQDAVNRSEQLRKNMAHPELRAVYSANRRELYEFLTDLFIQAHEEERDTDEYLRASINLAEKARSRLMIDLLREAAWNFGASVSPESRREQINIYRRLDELQYRRDQILERNVDSVEADAELGQVLELLADSEIKLDVLEGKLRRDYPQFRLGLDQSLSAHDIQALLEPGTTLLQFQLGEIQSYAWLINRDEIFWARLPSRSVIETATKPVIESLHSYANDTATRRQNHRYRETLANLLLDPLASHLQQQRLLIMADGILQYVPFGVLPLSGPDGRSENLINRSELILVPSMTVASALIERAGTKRPAESIAIFADPVFSRTDDRMQAFGVPDFPGQTSSPDLFGQQSTSTPEPLQRLLYTQQEVHVLENLVPAERLFVADGFAASRETLLSTNLLDFGILHFATHGLIDPRYPELSALALSQFDEFGTPRDGSIRLYDIYDFQLNARLVVLSACETALGRELRGEGLIGFTQGFLSAGARNLITSLWRVPDRATAELMEHFYRFLLNDNLDPAAALRNAQLALASETRWRDPYFWGAFIIVGAP
jgi:CHAT domain-containing protein